MYDQCLGIANIGQVRKKLQAFDELHPRFHAPLDAKGHDGAAALWQVLLGQRMIFAARQAWIIHPGYTRMVTQERRYRYSVLHMTFDAYVQRFQSLQQYPGAEWGKHGPERA